VRTLLVTILGLVVPLGTAWAQTDLVAGERLYEVCAGCHGFSGEGNALVNAPKLAGLETWYLTGQIHNFGAEIRGSADGDVHGQRMAAMAKALKTEREVADVVAYIATLPMASSPATIDGDADTGRAEFATCAACHGEDGSGNATVASPGIAGLDDWYLVEQLRLFADGLRGAHPEDTGGQQMRAIAASFADEQTRRDLAAFIRTLAH
jgi:cytochrome c oxidase subunit 2